MKAAIFDRDGTLIEHVHYLRDPAAVRLLPGVAEGVRRLMEAGILLFMHTNQSGIGRGYFTMADAEACNRRLIELLDLGPAPFRRICIAPERPDQPSAYRKPSPRFAHEVAAELSCRPADLCYLGDRASDLATAAAAGAHGIGITTGLMDLRAELAELQLADDYTICASFDEAVAQLLSLRSDSVTALSA